MAYGRRALGKELGFLMGWSMFLEMLFAAIGTALATGGYVAFLLNPVHVRQVADIALGGDVMPQKSTDFYPKLLSGVAIYRPEGQIGS